METAGIIFEGEWDSSFNAMCSEESDFMARLLGNSSIPNAAFWPGNGNDEMHNSSMFSFLNNNGFCMLDCKSNVMEGDDFLNAEELPQSLQEDQITSSKKRPRVLEESQRSKRLKNCAKIDEDENDDSKNATTTKLVLHRRSSSLCCSEDGVNSSSRGKTRASRGSATDPQSLYARKRRERINERLKILQNLVPNGTKVDLSTMLEEAVQYVKFLQLQIKLLSSEDMWMYAPIAYNGMDIGLDFKIPSTKPQS